MAEVYEEQEVADPSPERVKKVLAAISGWKNELVDLTARNNLLYYRDLKVGTLDLTEQSIDLDSMLAGNPVRLSDLNPGGSLKDLTKRAKNILKKADIAFEEKGIQPMFVAFGMAAWDEDRVARKSPPMSPVCLIPASLVEMQSGLDFELSFTGEPRVNPTLLRKLEATFQVRVDAESIDSQLVEAESASDLREVSTFLNSECQSVPGFKVTERLVLGTFSYSKLPMVLDLERAVDELTRHDLVAALGGDESARESLRRQRSMIEDPPIDAPDWMPPSSEHLVLDADSSQSQVINSVLAGKNMLVQGPPGTGKSQTISNLIASLMAEGKTVLFVAEKRAAIDAVFKRLRQVGLDHLLLDLHDGQKKRGQFAQELALSLDAGRNQTQPHLSKQNSSLVRAREKLNARDQAQHKVREPWNISVFDARVGLAAIPPKAESESRFTGAELEALDGEKFDEAQGLLREWFQLDADDVYRRGSVWADVRVHTSEDARTAHQSALDAKARFDEFLEHIGELSRQVSVTSPERFAEASSLIEMCERAARTLNNFDPSVFDLRLSEIVEALEPMGKGGAARFMASISSSSYRENKKLIDAKLTDTGRSSGPRALFEELSVADEVQREWDESGSPKPPWVPANLEASRMAIGASQAALASLAEWLPEIELQSSAFKTISGLLDEAATDRQTVVQMVEIRKQESGLVELGFGDLLSGISHDALDQDDASARLRHVWFSSIVDHLTYEDSMVSAIKGPSKLVAEFEKLDRAHIDTGPQKVRRACAERLHGAREENPEESELVERQAKFAPRSKKHLPVRKYFEKAPNVLNALKPCWAMSPLVVSQMLPARANLFDVVIFDEASQVTPAEAIPAILRGERIVVAGDSCQLPPTNFFMGMNEDEEESGEEDDAVDDGTQNFESILDALTSLVSARMLTWHYRSEDERLIAYSNAHIYDRRLTTFPGANGNEVIRFEKVPWEATISDKSNSPAAEVERVTDLIIEHAISGSTDSLGVIAMGVAHSTRITDRLDQKRIEMRDDAEGDPEAAEVYERLEAFLDREKLEPFFVKNLERVQGDERDVILMTIGYGKDPESGKMLYRFGPIQTDGGERRLNVAISRAKKRMVVISSFSPSEMDDEKLKSKGAQLLKGYLEYASSGGESLGRIDQLPPELNPFEAQIRDALEAEGMSLKAQHGVSGYKIDFAAKHPEEPGRYVLAIECDGASYHSSPTARERDRLRQAHLERLGWTFHRIWSSDWFENQPGEITKVKDAYDEAISKEAGGSDSSPPFDQAAKSQAASELNPSVDRGARPAAFRTYDPIQIASLIEWIESDTLLRTRDELAEETRTELGFLRGGSRIERAIDDAVAMARGGAPRSDESRETANSSGMDAYENAGSQRPMRRQSNSDESSKSIASSQPDAAEIVYAGKRAGSQTKTRIVNPQIYRGQLMWAYCHKVQDIRCFRVDRIIEWQAADSVEWKAPTWAYEAARMKAAGS